MVHGWREKHDGVVSHGVRVAWRVLSSLALVWLEMSDVRWAAPCAEIMAKMPSGEMCTD